MQNEKDVENGQINLKDIVDFFKSNGKLIAIMAAVGLVLSVVYLQLAPRKYEARLFLEMAQLSQGNIEAPTALVERLRYPVAYGEAAMKACGIADTREVDQYLDGMLMISASKAISNALEIKVRALTPALAKQCADSLVQMLEKQQYDLIEERLWGRNEQLASYKQALENEMRQLEKIRRPEAGSVGYLARLDRLSLLRTRIDALEEEAMLAHKHPTKLTMPISVGDKPVSPKVKLALLAGLLIGIFLGVVLALARTVWRKANA